MSDRPRRARALLTAALVPLLAAILAPPALPQEAPPPPKPSAAAAPQADVEALKKTAVKVYIAGDFSDLEYIKTEITFVNYVRDRKEADVHVLITSRRTGSEGREYTLSFIGQNGYADLQDVQRYFTEKTATEDEVRRGLVGALKLGLLAYVARTPIADRVSVGYREEEAAGPRVDPWKSWIFSLSGSGYFNGEKSHASRSLSGSFSASRVTAAAKLRLGLSLERQHDRFTYEGEDILSDTDGWEVTGQYIKSLGEHWGAGAFLSSFSSAFQNTELSTSVSPAVEYNVFPYSQSSRRQLRVNWRLSLIPVRYREVTIYEKTRETLVQQTLSTTLGLKEKWGSVTATLTGSHYFHDLKFYQVSLFTYLNLNLYKGFSVYVIGSAARIRDQLGLRKGDLTLDEIILRRREIATGYNYFAAFGLSFTFGSIYTNVVNPRFGSLRGSGVSIMMD